MRLWNTCSLAIPLAALLLCSSVTLAQEYSPAFPRDGAKKIQENDYFAIWDVTWEKGQSTGMRKLRLDQITVFLTDGAIRFTRPDGMSTIEEERLGSVLYEPKGTIVATEGTSENPIRAAVFQLKGGVPPKQPVVRGIPGLLPRPGAVKLFETARIIVWDDTWQPGVRTPVHLHYAQAAAVFLGGGTIGTFSANGAPGPTFSRKQGEVIISSHPKEPHAEEEIEGLPRAIWVEFK